MGKSDESDYADIAGNILKIGVNVTGWLKNKNKEDNAKIPSIFMLFGRNVFKLVMKFFCRQHGSTRRPVHRPAAQ